MVQIVHREKPFEAATTKQERSDREQEKNQWRYSEWRVRKRRHLL